MTLANEIWIRDRLIEHGKQLFKTRWRRTTEILLPPRRDQNDKVGKWIIY
jgi:hypothetical protein